MDTDGEKVYIFGGLGVSSKERFNELWIYNLKGTNIITINLYCFSVVMVSKTCFKVYKS